MADYTNQYLTFVALGNGTISCMPTNNNTIYCSNNNGVSWISIAVETEIQVNEGDRILWKCNMRSGSGVLMYSICHFSSSSNFYAEGNAMSLVYGDNFIGKTSQDITNGRVFSYMFNECTRLTSAENLILPMTTLTEECYGGMFNGCTSLTTAPELPATTLATHCYSDMFNGCTSLTTAPSVLPATTLAYGCYYAMFNGCTSLITAPEILATSYSSYSGGDCNFMFSGCTSLNYVKCCSLSESLYNTYLWLGGVSSAGTLVSNGGWSKGNPAGVPTKSWSIERCDMLYRWVKTDDTICVESGTTAIYRWINLDPSTDYYCSGTTKYYKQKKQQSTDSGQTWYDVIPYEYQMGGVYQTGSTDCCGGTQYRSISGTPYCNGYDKYVTVSYQKSEDCGTSWTTTSTTTVLVARNSTDCGYIPPSPTPSSSTCIYSYDKLDKVLYLISGNDARRIHIDDGEAYIDGYSGTPIILSGYSINFTEESSIDERYKFQKQVTFQVHGWADKSIFQDKYYIIIQSKDGTKWLVNVDFPSVITYDFRLNANEYQTTFTASTLSNHPTLKLVTDLPQGEYVCKQLSISGVKSLQIIEKEVAKLDKEEEGLYIDEGYRFLDVDFIGNSCSLEEQFDGKKSTTTIGFNVGFNDYKSSWHYNLLEFQNNRYRAIIKPKDNDYTFYCGFNFGLEPSYVVTATTTNEASDMVTVTLKEVSMEGITAASAYTEEQSSDKKWRYTQYYNGGIDASQCVGNGTARYLLMEETDSFGHATGRYKAYSGTSSMFPSLNIIGEFTEDKTFFNPQCQDDGCKVLEDFPSSMSFSESGCSSFTFSSACDWRIMNKPSWLTITPSSGRGMTSSIVNICCTENPPSSGKTSTFGIAFGNSIVAIRSYQVTLAGEQGLVYPNPQYINCLKQNVNFATNGCVELIAQPPQGVTVEFKGGQMVVNVPSNESTAETKTYRLGVRGCKSDNYLNVDIIQDKTYERWIDTQEIICESGDSYVKQQRLTGTSVDDTNTRTKEYRKGAFIQHGDGRCGAVTRWVWDGNYICDQGDKHKYEEEEVYSGGTWVKNGYTRVGEMVESASSWCEQEVQYRWVLTDMWNCEECGMWERTISSDTFCDDGNLCYNIEEQLSDDCGERWITTAMTKVVVESGASQCENPTYDTEYLAMTLENDGEFRWIGTEASSINNTVIKYSIDNGVTWEELHANEETDTIPANTVVLWKANFTPIQVYPYGIGHFSASTNFNVSGNPMSLLWGDDFIHHNNLSGMTWAFCDLFYDCYTLKDASHLKLISSTLVDSCYREMFANCRTLSGAPTLSATTLAPNCYANMFVNCRSLENAPALPATTLANNCYRSMFAECWSLQTAPTLPSTTMQPYCYYLMFSGSGLRTAPQLPASTLAPYCYFGMFNHTKIMALPTLSATTLADGCYASMFASCTGLTAIETNALPATTLAYACYRQMFQYCINLEEVGNLPATTLAEYCYANMFEGCEMLTAFPLLAATTVPSYAYNQMFKNCESLNNVGCLATTFQGFGNTDSWLEGVAEEGTFVKAADMNYWEDGDSGIPINWTVEDY